MQTVSIPWAAWYEQTKIDLSFPDAWRVTVADMKGGADIGDAGIRKALSEPIGSPSLRDLAHGKRSAAILVDDLSRPTPASRLLPYVLEELSAAGIDEDRVRIVAALAAHRPMVRDDFIKKLGPEIVERMYVVNHDAYGSLDFLGHSSRGVPVYVNRDFMACEVRIALGMITPRGGFFGGGSKLVLPGASGHVTITANHRHVHDGFREHLAEVGRMAGLGFIVNPLLNADLEIIALVAGDPEAAYWHGAELGKDLYYTDFPEDVDIGIFNAFPKDTELMQAGMALVPMRGAHNAGKIQDNATIVIVSASPEGLGWHSVYGPTGSLSSGRPGSPSKWRTIIFSPGVNKWDVLAKHGPDVLHCTTWPDVLTALQRHHGDGSHAAVFPCGAMQYGG